MYHEVTISMDVLEAIKNAQKYEDIKRIAEDYSTNNDAKVLAIMAVVKDVDE